MNNGREGKSLFEGLTNGVPPLKISGSGQAAEMVRSKAGPATNVGYRLCGEQVGA